MRLTALAARCGMAVSHSARLNKPLTSLQYLISEFSNASEHSVSIIIRY